MTAPIENKDTSIADQSNSNSSSVSTNRTGHIWDRVSDRFAQKLMANENANAHKLSAATPINTESVMRKIGTNTLLSNLWLFTLLNIIFRDIHELAKKSHLEQILATEVSELLLFVAGFVIEIPIAMVLFSLLFARRILRPITFVAALIVTAGMLSFPPTDLDDVFFLIIQLLALVTIMWTAWRWPQADPQSIVPT